MHSKRMEKIALATALMLLPTGCGKGADALCTHRSVHETVRELVGEQELGAAGVRLIPNAFSVRPDSATYVSTDKQTNTVRCSVAVVTDIFQLMSFGESEEDIQKLRAEAIKKGFPLSKETIVHFTVQTLASGQLYVVLIQ